MRIDNAFFVFLISIIFNRAFRLKVGLIVGIAINFMYAIENFVFAIVYNRLLWGVLSFYYAFLIAIRVYLISAAKYIPNIEKRDKWKICKIAGIYLIIIDFLFLITVTFSSPIAMKDNYSVFALVAVSVYSTYSAFSSVLGIISAKRERSVVRYAARNMTLTATLTSLYNLLYFWCVFLGVGKSILYFIIRSVGISVFFVVLFLAARLTVAGHGFRRFSYNESSG